MSTILSWPFFLMRQRGQQRAENDQKKEIQENKQGQAIPLFMAVAMVAGSGMDGKQSAFEYLHQPVEQKGQQGADQHARHNVGDEMHPQVDPGIAVECCPEERREDQSAMPEQKGKENSQSEAAGGMSGDKTIPAAPVTVDDIHQIFKGGMIGRPEPLKKWLEKGGGNLIA